MTLHGENGGGDYVKIKKSIYKFPTKEEAYNFVNIVKDNNNDPEA